MAKRSYQQYCGLAAAMDVVGERWAMLVVRDLVPGPRRFGDLFAGLPGIATDVLADRLRSLEAAGVVRQRRLRHPVPANVYELTERGLELASIAGRLAAWGQPLLPAPGSGSHRVHPRWALQSMVAGYRGGAPDGSYELVVDDEELTVTIDGATASIAYGPAHGAPDVRLTCTSATFFRLARNPEVVERLPASAHLEGDPGRLRALVEAMPLQVGSAA